MTNICLCFREFLAILLVGVIGFAMEPTFGHLKRQARALQLCFVDSIQVSRERYLSSLLVSESMMLKTRRHLRCRLVATTQLALMMAR